MLACFWISCLVSAQFQMLELNRFLTIIKKMTFRELFLCRSLSTKKHVLRFKTLTDNSQWTHLIHSTWAQFFFGKTQLWMALNTWNEIRIIYIYIYQICNRSACIAYALPQRIHQGFVRYSYYVLNIFNQNRNHDEKWCWCLVHTPPKSNKAPENQRLEDDSFPLHKWSLLWIEIPSFSGVYPPEN